MEKLDVGKPSSAAGGVSLLILNQMAGPMTWELAEDLGKELGPVALLTGHPDTLAKDGGDKVLLCPAVPYHRGSYVRRLLSWLLYFAQAALWLWRWPASTPLLLYSNPPILPWLGYLARKLRGQRYSVMVHDIHPDVLVRLGVIAESHLAVRVWRWLNRRAYERAEVVMTLGECMAANLAKQFDPSRTKAGEVKVIYPWVDTDVIRPIPKEQNWFAQQYGQVGKLTVMYSGNMGMAHDLETMLEAAQRLRDLPDVHFMFIGAGPKWQLVADTIRDKALANVTLLPWQPEEVLPYSLATADVALVSIEPGVEGLAVPSKAMCSMAAGAYVILLAERQGELAAWVGRSAQLVRPGDAAALCDEILLTMEKAVVAQKRCLSAHTAAERFGRRRNVDVLLSLLGRYLQTSRPQTATGA